MPVRGTPFNLTLCHLTNARKEWSKIPTRGVMEAELNAYDALGLSFESNPDDATIRKVRRRERDASSCFVQSCFVDSPRAREWKRLTRGSTTLRSCV